MINIYLLNIFKLIIKANFKVRQFPKSVNYSSYCILLNIY